MVGKFVPVVVVLIGSTWTGVQAADSPTVPVPPPPLNSAEQNKPPEPATPDAKPEVKKGDGDRKDEKSQRKDRDEGKGDRRDGGRSERKDGDWERRSEYPPNPVDLPGKFRAHYDRLSPTHQRQFMENWSRWRSMEPREREKLMTKALEERRRVEKVVDDTLKKLGLELDADRREVFELRYRQERRKIEEGLRKEFEAMRAERVDEMLGELKKEFEATGPTVPAKPKSKPSAKPEVSPVQKPAATPKASPAPKVAAPLADTME